MLVSANGAADFSRGCAHPATRPPIPATHHHSSIRESSSLSALRSTANGTDNLPFTSWGSSGPIVNGFMRRS